MEKVIVEYKVCGYISTGLNEATGYCSLTKEPNWPLPLPLYCSPFLSLQNISRADKDTYGMQRHSQWSSVYLMVTFYIRRNKRKDVVHAIHLLAYSICCSFTTIREQMWSSTAKDTPGSSTSNTPGSHTDNTPGKGQVLKSRDGNKPWLPTSVGWNWVVAGEFDQPTCHSGGKNKGGIANTIDAIELFSENASWPIKVRFRPLNVIWLDMEFKAGEVNWSMWLYITGVKTTADVSQYWFHTEPIVATQWKSTVVTFLSFCSFWIYHWSWCSDE